MKYKTFDEYVKSKEIDRYVKTMTDTVQKSNYVIKYENLKEDIKHVNESLSIVDNNISLIRSYNVHNGVDLRNKKSYKHYYNEITKAIIKQKFKYILNKFNYKF